MSRFVRNLWGTVDPAITSASDEVDLLLHRSHALGADLAVTNFAGGNTSCKTTEADPLTSDPVEVLWVKGSGGDLGTMPRKGLATLSLARMREMKGRYHGEEHEDEMVGLLGYAVFGQNPTPPSIDAPLHAFIPYRHVDHLHPDSVIALAAAEDGERLTKEIFGDEILWSAWRRPGWELGLELERLVAANPQARGAVMGGHGLITWADTAEECYRASLEIIERAAAYLDAHGARVGDPTAFGEVVIETLPEADRRRLAAALAPTLRGLVSTDRPRVGRFVDTPEVLDFLSREKAPALARQGTSCPDHFLRTKVQPLFLDLPPSEPIDKLIARLKELHADYRTYYASYYDTYREPDSPAMRGADPAVILLPGIGMWTFGPEATTARLAGEYFVNAINVMRGAEAVSSYAPIPDREKFRIEYWALEEAKLRRQPAPKALAGKVALVVGGASGIGRATAARLAGEGATLVVADLDSNGAAALVEELGGPDKAVGLGVDASEEKAVVEMVHAACLAYGGVDIVVQSAGVSISKPLAETTVSDWDLQHNVMVRGSFLIAREAAAVMAAQAVGGDIVLIVSKNALFAGPDNCAYGSAKAAQAHLVRLLAAELGKDGIRVNGVNPDGVVHGSGIFAGGWGAKRAAVYGVPEEDLGKFYAQRTLLKQEILPEDVAAAVAVLVGADLKRTTGTLIPVDGGVPAAFLR